MVWLMVMAVYAWMEVHRLVSFLEGIHLDRAQSLERVEAWEASAVLDRATPMEHH